MSNETGDAPTDEQVERAARVLLQDYQMQYEGGKLHEFFDLARAALAAAGVAPPIPSETAQRIKREWMAMHEGSGFEDLYSAEFDRMLTGSAPPAPSAEASCSGASLCPSSEHEHGCFADRGNCDDPSEHEQQPAPSDDREKLDHIVSEYDAALYSKEETLDRLAAGLAAAAPVDADRVRAVLNEYSVVHHHPEYGIGLFTTCAEEIADALAAPDTVDEVKLAKVIESAGFEWHSRLDERLIDNGEDPGPLSEFTAAAVTQWLSDGHSGLSG